MNKNNKNDDITNKIMSSLSTNTMDNSSSLNEINNNEKVSSLFPSKMCKVENIGTYGINMCMNEKSTKTEIEQCLIKEYMLCLKHEYIGCLRKSFSVLPKINVLPMIKTTNPCEVILDEYINFIDKHGNSIKRSSK